MQPRETAIRDILNGYSQEEQMIEQKLHECEVLRHEMKSKQNSTMFEHFDFLQNNISVEQETSQLRNQRFLKDLEKSKARLRTLATFTPTDQELHDLATFYRHFLVDAQASNTR